MKSPYGETTLKESIVRFEFTMPASLFRREKHVEIYLQGENSFIGNVTAGICEIFKNVKV
jgi:hypothetical protein